jgi:hypothetical protein
MIAAELDEINDEGEKRILLRGLNNSGTLQKWTSLEVFLMSWKSLDFKLVD